MSKRIKIPARATEKASADQWVQQKTDASPTVKPKRLTIDIAPDLHRQLRLYCFHRDIVVADFLRGVIAQAISGDEPTR